MLRLFQTILSLLLLLHGCIQQLFGIVLTHLWLRLLLFLVLLILVFILILLLLVFLIVLFLILFVLILILLVLILFLFLMFTENQVVAGLIICRIQTQGILIGLYRLTVHLMRLTDDTNIMERLVFAQGVRLQLRSILKLFDGCRVFLLRHQGITQVIHSLRVLRVLLHRLSV